MQNLTRDHLLFMGCISYFCLFWNPFMMCDCIVTFLFLVLVSNVVDADVEHFFKLQKVRKRISKMERWKKNFYDKETNCVRFDRQCGRMHRFSWRKYWMFKFNAFIRTNDQGIDS